MTPFSIQLDVDLTSLNTFGFAVRAARYAAITSAEQLSVFLSNNETTAQPLDLFILGGGSNLVLTRDVDAVVLHMVERGWAIEREDSSHVWVRVAAGEVWHEWVMASVDRGWMGLENLALIPGSVGACPVQNIGAYGSEVKDTIVKVNAFDRLTQTSVELDGSACHFAYRDSIFKHSFLYDAKTQPRYIIVGVVFKLLKDVSQWQPKVNYGDVAIMSQALADAQAGEAKGVLTAKHVAQAVMAIRRSKLPDPKALGNAGSFFKNPVVAADVVERLKKSHPMMPSYPQTDGMVKIAAGWLIEQSGFKGYRDGPIGVYDKQALVLVNHGGGNGELLMAMAAHISDVVFTKFGVRISPEPIVY